MRYFVSELNLVHLTIVNLYQDFAEQGPGSDLGKKLSGLVTRQRRQVGCDWRDTRLQMTFFTIVNLANDGVCLYINDFESGPVSPVVEIRDLNKTEERNHVIVVNYNQASCSQIICRNTNVL